MFLLTICSGRQVAEKWVFRIRGDGADATDSGDLEIENNLGIL